MYGTVLLMYCLFVPGGGRGGGWRGKGGGNGKKHGNGEIW